MTSRFVNQDDCIYDREQGCYVSYDWIANTLNEIDGGVGAITLERMRQKQVEGWTAEHDAQWTDGELVKASICYSLAAVGKQSKSPSFYWPWAAEWYKPRFDDSDLIRAGALIAAELDRRQCQRAKVGQDDDGTN